MATVKRWSEEQNHRVVKVGRELWRPSGPISAQVVTPREVCPQPGSFWRSPRRLHSGHLCQCSIACTANQCFLTFRWNFLWYSLYLLPFMLALGTTGKSLTQSSFCPPFRFLYTFLSSSCKYVYCTTELTIKVVQTAAIPYVSCF